jgi:hypothetical protein
MSFESSDNSQVPTEIADLKPCGRCIAPEAVLAISQNFQASKREQLIAHPALADLIELMGGVIQPVRCNGPEPTLIRRRRYCPLIEIYGTAQ